MQATSDITAFWRQALRALPIVVGCAVMVGMAAWVLSNRQPAQYAASTDVFVQTDQIGAPLANLQVNSADPIRTLTTQAAVARIPEVLSLAAKRVPGNVTPDELLGATSVTIAESADIMTFSAIAGTQQRAVDFANGYAQGYVDYRRNVDTQLLRRALEDATAQLEDLRRQGRRRDEVYAQLEARQQDLRQRTVLAPQTATVGRLAQGAAQTQPRTSRNVMLGTVLGLLMGIVVALLLTTLNTRVRSPEEVDALLGVPLLGRIPTPRRRFRHRGGLAMLDAAADPSAEAYRMLGTSLELANLDRAARSIMVTSATVGEGKSVTVANVAVSLARSGSRVVLVDLDLRQPTLHALFDIENDLGLTDVALGRVELADALREIPVAPEGVSATGAFGGSLHVLPTGFQPPNPAEFVRSRPLSVLLDAVADVADLVLIDSPPLLHVSDGMTLTAKVDAVVIAVKVPAIRRGQLRELRRLLDSAPVVKLGYFATGSDDAEPSGTYGRSKAEVERTSTA